MTPNLIILLRERSPFEAIDLGIRLVQTQHHLWQGWVVFACLIALIVWAIIPSESLWLGIFLTWWLKPLYERFLLQGLSQSIMSQPLTLMSWFNTLPRLVKHTGLLEALLWRRFSLVRSYVQPIWQLEQLPNKAERAKRRRLITAQFNRHAAVLTLALLSAQLAILVSCYALLYLFDPTDATKEHIQSIFSGYLDREEEYWHHLLDYSLWVVSLIIIQPFYVAAGFCLYLNRRTHLEAWDLEQALRAIGQRIKAHNAKLAGSVTTVLLALLILVNLPQPSHANTVSTETSFSDEYLAPERADSHSAKPHSQTIALDHPQATRTAYRWVAKSDVTDSTAALHTVSNPWAKGIAQFIEAGLWVALIIIGLLLIIYRSALLKWLRPKRANKTRSAQPPASLFGLALTAESLPEDIVQAAQQAWQAERYREALSLLYRSLLHRLTYQQGLPITTHHTEGDVIKVAQTQVSTAQLDYLKLLTQHWLQTAYGHVKPSSDTLTHLLQARNKGEAG